MIATAYDDGGTSGGTMQRPALQRLLAEIQAGKIDVVVVYKVDRLTRSLADFAKMVEVFDAHGVSFVAVTQQFNTTSSMGRLTLNVLLSFVQFEREVTGVRIRDKIAASKKKGMWMGGTVPLGYRVEDRKLLPIQDEAERVRDIYRRYLDSSGVRELASVLRRDGLQPKARKGRPAAHFSRGALYALLSNPIYVGRIRHKKIHHPGQHEGIVDPALWAQVQDKLKSQAVRDGGPNRKTESSPLTSKLVDEGGRKLIPSHAVKRGRRYRYYVSAPTAVDTQSTERTWRLPAADIERRVEAIVAQALADRLAVTSAALRSGLPEAVIGSALTAATTVKDPWSVVERVGLGREELKVVIAIPFDPVIRFERVVPVQMRRRGVESRLVIPGEKPESGGKPDPALFKAVGRALRWWEWMTSGQVKTTSEIASREGIKERYVQRVLPLAMLAPDIIEAIAQGRQPVDLTAQKLLLRTDIPLGRAAQRQLLGFA